MRFVKHLCQFSLPGNMTGVTAASHTQGDLKKAGSNTDLIRKAEKDRTSGNKPVTFFTP
jgi:hypothetical protein